eukprot:4238498-Pleurochrysis_carterae.AAC.1
MEMHANSKAKLSEDHSLRDDANWARITFLIQDIWTSGPAHIASKIGSSDFSCGNYMTLITLADLLKKVISLFTKDNVHEFSP